MNENNCYLLVKIIFPNESCLNLGPESDQHEVSTLSYSIVTRIFDLGTISLIKKNDAYLGSWINRVAVV